MWGDDDPDMQLSDDDGGSSSRYYRKKHFQNVNSTSSKWHQRLVLPAAATIASFGGVVFGYDIGIISGALLQLRSVFKLSCHEQEMIVATLVIGALVASLCGGYLLDRYGRRRMIIINAFIFMIGAAILAGSHFYSMFIIGRFVIGFSVSLSAIADCIYISEIASSRWRGFLVSMNEMGITIGILVSYLMNYLLVNEDDGWRYMFIISAFPAMLQVFGMLFLPASPRWLVSKDEDSKAIETIQTLWPKVDPTEELDRLKNSLSTEKDYSFFHMFTKRENLRMRMFVGCGIVFFQQLSGQPTVLYYAPILLKNLGYNSNVSATLATIGLGIVKVLFTFIVLCTVDKLGRRTFILAGATVMTVSVVTLSGLTVSLHNTSAKGCNDVVGSHRLHSHLLTPKGNCNYVKNSTMLNDIHSHPGPFNCTVPQVSVDTGTSVSQRYASLIALMFFVIGYSIGYGPMSWLLLSEIFPTGIKGRAVGIVSSVNWSINILLSMTFLDVIDALGPFWMFLTYALIGIIAIFFHWQFVPETRGKSLEKLSMELSQNVNPVCTVAQCCMRRPSVAQDEEWHLLVNNNETGVYCETAG